MEKVHVDDHMNYHIVNWRKFSTNQFGGNCVNDLIRKLSFHSCFTSKKIHDAGMPICRINKSQLI